jgi:hypothetical protein
MDGMDAVIVVGCQTAFCTTKTRATIESTMIRPTTEADFDTILAIINDAAQAYCCLIPADC